MALRLQLSWNEENRPGLLNHGVLPTGVQAAQLDSVGVGEYFARMCVLLSLDQRTWPTFAHYGVPAVSPVAPSPHCSPTPDVLTCALFRTSLRCLADVAAVHN